MRYCPRCITPSTRPHIRFDENGRCNCAAAQGAGAIDWKSRASAFRRLVDGVRGGGRGGYDCVIPVSGGKDSTWQVVTCLEHGLRPLCVTWRPPLRTDIGQRNLDNLISLGVDHIDWSINPAVEKAFMYRAFARFASPAVPMHMAIFAIPLTVAVRFAIPLVVFGENSAYEYGGEDEQRRSLELNRAWLLAHGCTFGTTAEDWVGPGLDRRALTPYVWPTDAELASVPVRAVFLGAYFQWDPRHAYAVARAHGFREAGDGPLTGQYAFADIDDPVVAIHHWLKWYKFGITRSFDNLSLEIRSGRLRRADALEILRARGDETPHAAIDAFCACVGIERAHFFEVAERFRNPDVWERRDGTWRIRDFLIPDWKWS